MFLGELCTVHQQTFTNGFMTQWRTYLCLSLPQTLPYLRGSQGQKDPWLLLTTCIQLNCLKAAILRRLLSDESDYTESLVFLSADTCMLLARTVIFLSLMCIFQVRAKYVTRF